MNCPQCQHPNRSDARFCLQCGAAFAVRCPQCATELPGGARFCDRCGAACGGAPVDTVSVAAAVRTASRPAMSSRLAERIRGSRSSMEGERKQVTVLFADVKGSMEMAEQLDPEAWGAIMERFFGILSDGVERFEGFVDKFTGDGIMALFGAPIAHENHAHRACYAALHLRDATRRYADELRRTEGLSLSVRIGLNSGDVVVGSVGDDLRMDYTAQGHTVGLAQRMEQRAAADSVYLTEHTAALVRGYFDLRDLGAFDLKGASAPVVAHELLGLGALRSRLDRSRERGFSRFVGRAGEMAVLDAALGHAVEGRGGAVGVVADAGVGKSRLCTEFLEGCRARGVAVFEAHCVSHGQAVPLLPILELMRGYFGINARDSDQQAREKIAGRLVLLDRELESFLPVAFDFLGVPDPARPAPALEPAQRQRQIFAFTRLLVQSRSEREPGVIFVDDAHWIDPASDAFVAQVADIVAGTRTVLLLNFRPGYAAEWMGRPFYQQVALQPLGDEALDELLAELLGADPSLVDLTRQVRERSGGNPFFIEEIVQALVESGQLEGSRGARRLARPLARLDLPPTVHGILAARIDRLAAREKSLLQTAAVIGRRFSASLLLRVSGLAEQEFEAAVAVLRNTDFLQEESIYPEVEYAFRHPLSHEVAERSQLGSHRRRVHRAVAGILEEVHADRPGEHAPLLAHHWDLGEEAAPAMRWHQRAAEWIAGSNAPAARRHWERVRDLAGQSQDPALSLSLGLQSRIMILEYGWRLGLAPEEAREMVREGEEWARRHGDPRSLAALCNAFSMPCLFSLGDTGRTRELLDEGLPLAEQAGDGALACAIELRMFFLENAIGDVPGMQRAMDAVLRHEARHLQEASALVGYDVPATVAGYRGFPDMAAGRLDRALEHFRRGFELAEAAEAVEVKSWLFSMEGTVHLLRGDSARAVQCGREMLEIADRIENPLSQAMARRDLGNSLLLQGDAAAAEALLEESAARLKHMHAGLETETLGNLAVAQCAAGKAAQARETAQRALDLATERGFRRGAVSARRALAAALLAQGDGASLTEAGRQVDRAESEATEIGNRAILPELDEIRGRIARRGGDEAAARAAFARALDSLRGMGATARIERLERELAA